MNRFIFQFYSLQASKSHIYWNTIYLLLIWTLSNLLLKLWINFMYFIFNNFNFSTFYFIFSSHQFDYFYHALYITFIIYLSLKSHNYNFCLCLTIQYMQSSTDFISPPLPVTCHFSWNYIWYDYLSRSEYFRWLSFISPYQK